MPKKLIVYICTICGSKSKSTNPRLAKKEAERCEKGGKPEPKFLIGSMRHNNHWAFEITGFHYVRGQKNNHAVHYTIEECARFNNKSKLWWKSVGLHRVMSETRIENEFAFTLNPDKIIG